MSYFSRSSLWFFESFLIFASIFPLLRWLIWEMSPSFQRLGKRERKSPGKYSLYKCTCTGGGGTTNWRLTIIMIIYLASISRREVKCETVTEISTLLWCQMSQFQLCHQTDTMKVIYKNTLIENQPFSRLFILGGISTVLGDFWGHFGPV